MSYIIPVIVSVATLSFLLQVGYILWCRRVLREWVGEQNASIVSVEQIKNVSRLGPSYWWECRLHLRTGDGTNDEVTIRYGGLPPRVERCE